MCIYKRLAQPFQPESKNPGGMCHRHCSLCRHRCTTSAAYLCSCIAAEAAVAPAVATSTAGSWPPHKLTLTPSSCARLRVLLAC